jgi:hypothetical protein
MSYDDSGGGESSSIRSTISSKNEVDPDLLRLLEAWPTLPEPLRTNEQALFHRGSLPGGTSELLSASTSSPEMRRLAASSMPTKWSISWAVAGRELHRRHDVPSYRDPEWQANVFAAAVLMPAARMTIGNSPQTQRTGTATALTPTCPTLSGISPQRD